MKLRISGPYIHVRMNRDEATLVENDSRHIGARRMLVARICQALSEADGTVIENCAPRAQEDATLSERLICGAPTMSGEPCSRGVYAVGHSCFQHRKAG